MNKARRSGEMKKNKGDSNRDFRGMRQESPRRLWRISESLEASLPLKLLTGEDTLSARFSLRRSFRQRGGTSPIQHKRVSCAPWHEVICRAKVLY